MSFYNCMKPYLNSQDADDAEWYVRATHQALNKYMEELENYMSTPHTNQVNGTTIVPGTPPITVEITGPLAYFEPNKIRLTYSEVKTAMWCGNPKLTFINLFNLFGEKFSLNFSKVNAKPTLNIKKGICIIPTTTWNICGTQLYAEAQAIGESMTPDKFLTIESLYMQLSIQQIPQITVPLIGTGKIPEGAFTGTAIMQFNTIIV